MLKETQNQTSNQSKQTGECYSQKKTHQFNMSCFHVCFIAPERSENIAEFDCLLKTLEAEKQKQKKNQTKLEKTQFQIQILKFKCFKKDLRRTF